MEHLVEPFALERVLPDRVPAQDLQLVGSHNGGAQPFDSLVGHHLKESLPQRLLVRMCNATVGILNAPQVGHFSQLDVTLGPLGIL